LLNNDTVVDPDILRAFMDVIKAFPHAGVLGAKIYYFDDLQSFGTPGEKFILKGVVIMRGVQSLI